MKNWLKKKISQFIGLPELEERLENEIERRRKIEISIRKFRCEIGIHNFYWSAYDSLNVEEYNEVKNNPERYKEWYFYDKCSSCVKEKPLSRIYPLLNIKEENALTYEEYLKCQLPEK